MKYIKLFEEFDPSEIPQTEPQFTQWMIKNAPKAVLNPQEWFESEISKPEPDWVFISSIIKELDLLNRLSIPKGAKEEYRLDDSFTLLHWATMNNHPELAKVLIDAGADVNAEEGEDKDTPLHNAVWHGYIELAKALIDAGADVNAENKWKSTPLHNAAWYQHPELVKVLIEAGADLDAKNSAKKTPLHFVARRNIKIAKMLIDAGADVNAEDEDGKTPWDYASLEISQALPELNPNL
jgi:cytohesin